ncbi:MAG: sulfotransferase [Gammaproteobacteria bacterium]|nr:sulfotransferase [Gammaproteobacteria bacterium]
MTNGRLPDFIIGGAQKAGSTWLAEMLGHHPQLFVPPRELHFFDRDDYFARGEQWYRQFFTEAAEQQLCGEKTPDYLLAEKADGSRMPAAARIREMLPEVKLLFVLRDPVTRAISALRHHLWFRRFPVSAGPDEILFGRHAAEAERWAILSNGLYSRQLRHYYDLFPSEHIRVWIFEDDVKGDPLALVQDAAAFIGVSADAARIDPDRVSNRGVTSTVALRGNYYLPFLAPGWQVLDRLLKRKFVVSQDCLDRLTDYYRKDADELARMLGRPLDKWSGRSKPA